MKNKLIELLNDHCDYADHVDCKEDCTACLADHLLANGVTIGKDNNVPTGWIPVEERLPGYGERVLITNGTSVWESYLSISHKWVRYEGIWMDIQVTHWMPLPKGPKEEKDD